MIIQIFHLVAIILHTPIVSGLHFRVNFCKKYPNSFYCEPKELPNKVDIPKCGNEIRNVSFPRLNYFRFVKQLNIYRKEMATGRSVSNGKKFPTVGDMVIMQWSEELEQAAKNTVRHCFTGEHGDVPSKLKRDVPSLEAKIVGAPLYSRFTTRRELLGKPNDIFMEELYKWKKDELKQLAKYTEHKGILNDNPSLKLIVYGRQRLIGCGNVYFESRDTNPSLHKVFGLCYVSPAYLSTSSLMMLGEKECTACQPKSECAKNGLFARTLCAYTGDGMRLQRNWTHIAIILLFVTLI